MLFWLILILFIAILIIEIWLKNNHINYFLIETSSFLSIMFGVILIIMIIVIIYAHIAIPAQVARFEQRFESLQYQLSNNVYDNDNDIGKADLYKEVERWNRDLAYRKEAQNDFWIGLFYANIYDQFDFIKYPEVN